MISISSALPLNEENGERRDRDSTGFLPYVIPTTYPFPQKCQGTKLYQPEVKVSWKETLRKAFLAKGAQVLSTASSSSLES